MRRSHAQFRLAHYLILLVVVGLVGCSPELGSRGPVVIATPLPTLTPPPKTVQPLSSDLPTRWLAGEPCSPPCWEGITPGKTRLTDAIDMLNHHPQVAHLAIFSSPLSPDGVVEWKWQGEHHGGELGYQQNSNPELVLVDWVSVNFFPNRYSLAPIVAAYGKPSHIAPDALMTSPLPHSGGGVVPYYKLAVVYQDQGFYMTNYPGGKTPPPIGPDMALSYSVTFFAPTAEGLSKALESTWGGDGWIQHYLLPWQGYQDFAVYCQQLKNPEAPCPGLKR